MSLKEYIKDHLTSILIYLCQFIFITLSLLTFKVNYMLLFFILSSLIVGGFSVFIINYYKKYSFYHTIRRNLTILDKKYLAHEMMECPASYEGRVLYEYISEINTAMLNHLNTYKYTLDDFKQYLSLWVHEIKIPLASASLILENNKGDVSISLLEELNRIEQLVEQVLFYVRSEHVEKDYNVKQSSLDEIVNKVIVEYRKSFIYKKITLKKEVVHESVFTDAKWMEFILSQIIANSIKYAKDENAYVRIYSKEEDNFVALYIEDNGIGIASNDITRVFDKGFTGENGRLKYKSTGIGLYLCKSLCEKLHHQIFINSTLHEGCTIKIVFPKNEMLNILK